MTDTQAKVATVAVCALVIYLSFVNWHAAVMVMLFLLLGVHGNGGKG